MLWSKKITKVLVPNHEILSAQQKRQKLVACGIWVLLEHSRAIELLPRSVLGTIVLMERNSKTVTTARASVSFIKL